MGSNKALLVFAGQTLVERGVFKLAQVCSTVAIAGGGAELAQFGTIVPDDRPGCGPLGGIVSALESSRFAWSLFFPVDVPLMTVTFMGDLAERCLASNAVAVLPRVSGHVEPLCAGYHRGALPGLRAALGAGQWKVTTALEISGAVEYWDVRADKRWFINVNTPEEFAAAERELDGAAESN